MQNIQRFARLSLAFVAFFCVLSLNGAESSTHSHHTKTSKTSQQSPSATMLEAMHAPMMEVTFLSGENIDLNFLTNMIPHHQGAIDSAEILLKHSKNKSLRTIAQNIITAQKAEIAEFKALLPELEKQDKIYSPKEITLFNKEAKEDAEAMHKAMSIQISGNIDKDFMLGMSAHHQGAVDASKQVLQYTQNTKIAEIAKRIIADQEKEIAEFKAMLEKIK